jgi:hypothetical protein
VCELGDAGRGPPPEALRQIPFNALREMAFHPRKECRQEGKSLPPSLQIHAPASRAGRARSAPRLLAGPDDRRRGSRARATRNLHIPADRRCAPEHARSPARGTSRR